MDARARLILVGAIAALVGFAAGALWQYSSVRSKAERLDATSRDLTFQQLEATLGAATIEAQRGSYELARQLASDFFTKLQANYTEAGAGLQQAFREILGSRDQMITALSRSDPQSGSLLAQLFIRYRLAMGEPVGPEQDTAPAPAATPGGS